MRVGIGKTSLAEREQKEENKEKEGEDDERGPMYEPNKRCLHLNYTSRY